MAKEGGGEIGVVPWEPCLLFSMPVRADSLALPSFVYPAIDTGACMTGSHMGDKRSVTALILFSWQAALVVAYNMLWVSFAVVVPVVVCLRTPNLVCGMCHFLPAEKVHQVMPWWEPQSTTTVCWVCVNSIAPNAIAILLHILLPPPFSTVTQPHLHHHLLPGFAQACLWGLPPLPAPVEGALCDLSFYSQPLLSSSPFPSSFGGGLESTLLGCPVAVHVGVPLSPAGPLPLPQLVRHSPSDTLCFIVQYVAVGTYMNR